MSRRNASASVRGGNPRTEAPGPSVRRRRRGYDADTRGPRLENESFFHTNGGDRARRSDSILEGQLFELAVSW